MKIKVKTSFKTFFECEVEASSTEEAKDKAAEVFWDTPDNELYKTLFKNREFLEEQCSVTEE